MNTPSNRVALFVTCLVDQLMPEIGVATVRVLRRARLAASTALQPGSGQGATRGLRKAGALGVDFPAAQTCCGQPFFNSGFRDEAARLAKRTIEIFEEHETVVLPSGSCTAMIRVEYPRLLAGESGWRDRAQKLAAKTFELSAFLARCRASFSFREALRIMYHDSCHLCRTLGLRDEPRKLLAESGCEIVEMAESDRCCGFGGLFSVRMPEVSNAMTAEKLRQAAATGVDVLVTADPGCLMQMRGMLETADRKKGTLRIEHIAVILEERTR
ncbi:MAG: (Fe-S)-binding protein [Anaerolineales bacterium]